MKYKVRINGKEYEVDVEELGRNKFTVTVSGKSIEVEVLAGAKEATQVVTEEAKAVTTPKPPVGAGGKLVTAPTPGKVIEVRVKPGDTVKENDVVVILESMKMNIEVYAGYSGRVREVYVKPGDFVDLGQAILSIE